MSETRGFSEASPRSPKNAAAGSLSLLSRGSLHAHISKPHHTTRQPSHPTIHPLRSDGYILDRASTENPSYRPLKNYAMQKNKQPNITAYSTVLQFVFIYRSKERQYLAALQFIQIKNKKSLGTVGPRAKNDPRVRQTCNGFRALSHSPPAKLQDPPHPFS